MIVWDRVAARLTIESPAGCWLWTGAARGVAPNKYGVISVDGRPVATHRLVYELLIGPIPAGLQIDHLCRESLCVNPLHLEAVTASENMRRGTRGKPRSRRVPTWRAVHVLASHERLLGTEAKP